MIYLYIFALLIHAAFSSTCKDGAEIASKETRNPKDLLGIWTYVYHWDNQIKYPNDFADTDRSNQASCPEIQVAPIAPDYVKSKVVECAKSKIPFNWNDAKLRLDGPAMNMTGGIIAIGKKDSWLMVDCKTFVRIVIRTVFDNYLVLTNPDVPGASEMMARKIPSSEELKCVAHNMDALRGIHGVGLCYKH